MIIDWLECSAINRKMDDKNKFVVAALYKFVKLDDYIDMQQPLLRVCKDHSVKGTLLLAEEGINGTISGLRSAIDAVINWLKQDSRLSDLDHKESYSSFTPFHRMKVRLKKEIVTLGVASVDPLKEVGTYVEPEDWNQIISDPEVTVIDTRNDYETAVGKFKNALDPQTPDFRHFPKFVEENLDPSKNKKVAMYCTGGIRCEKSTSYLLQKGFEKVYHLKGGILKYLEKIPQKESLWEGECFVFDDRIAINHQLEKGSWEICFGCKTPISEEDRRSEHYIKGIQCPHCYDVLTPERKRALEQRQHQIELAKARGEAHIGDAPGRAYRPAWAEDLNTGEL